MPTIIFGACGEDDLYHFTCAVNLEFEDCGFFQVKVLSLGANI